MAIIYGKNAILELLNTEPSKIEKVILGKGINQHKALPVIVACKKAKVRFDYVPVEKITTVCGQVVHQSIAAYITDFKYTELEDLKFSENAKVVILDEIEDPHNLGAIIRSAYASGVVAVIIPKRNSASVTDTVIKVSAGTALNIPVVKVTNLVNAIKFLKDQWFHIVGTAIDGGKDYNTFEFDGKTGVVIGGEGKGMRRLVKENCDDLIYIPLKNNVESLNASVAAALILFR